MWVFFRCFFYLKKFLRMVKVNVLSNLLLIYRKFVNYGYLFVSIKYEK